MRRPTPKRNHGFTIVEIMVVAIIIGILCAIALPNFAKIRNNAYRDQCTTNLQRIVAAKEHWSMETGALDTDTPTALQLDPYIKNGTSS
ncbi:MAG: type II secretion system GspH family protein, partial [Candidatus Omnitrophica bacterium]|nr:type II secretion system GspH family protein [Candidatus Omnitrophota bacterium]MCG2705654.1 type II secretion system GspH family protein [Candidatus Omnitrophota bacterium]